jgi:cytoskeletal protein CcmA (bactofilin family)
MSLGTFRQFAAVLVVVAVVLGALPGVVAAQEVRTGGSIVVGPGETVSGDLVATAGSVIVHGTVDGNLEATAGSVLVAPDGRVAGDVVATSGSVVVAGAVDGSVAAFGGSATLAEGATVGGDFEAAAGDVHVAGTVGGDARVAADRLVVASTGSVAGDLEYDVGSLQLDGSVAGATMAVDEVSFVTAPAFQFGPVGAPELPAIPAWVGAVYWFLANLLLGVVLLAVAPDFGRRVASLGTARTLRSGLAGLLVLVVTPVVLLLLLVSIVGIPLSLAGIAAFALVLWAAGVYGAYAVGTWLLSLADRADASRWLALVAGLLVVALVGAVPLLGDLVQFVVLLLGLGAFALAVRGESTGEGDGDAGAADAETGRPAA